MELYRLHLHLASSRQLLMLKSILYIIIITIKSNEPLNEFEFLF